jgi:uncharacterized glyoxalase superfamily protein PhnB
MTTTALQVRSLTPTLTVNDLKRSIQFYRDGLGFTVGEEIKEDNEVRHVTLEAGGATLGLSQDDFGKGRDRVKGVGLRFYLETDQSVEELAKRAKSAGITHIDGPAKLPWGPMGFTVTDPDGFKITISNPS